MKERILVTGGTGYIGSHTVVELQNNGYEVIIIDNLSNSSADVVDLAKAHVIAIRRILEQKQKEKVEVFNIGTGRGVSVLELIHGFEKATGVKLNYQIVGRRAGDIEKVWANPDFANQELGWKAVETLEDTLRSAWNWQLKLRERGIQ